MVVQVRPGDGLVPVPGFVALVAVARRGVLVGWAWLRDAVGVDSVHEARHRGVEFEAWERYSPSPVRAA